MRYSSIFRALLSLALTVMLAEPFCLGFRAGREGPFLRPLPTKHRHSSSDITWPLSYSVSYTFSLPYTGTVQDNPVSYDVTFHRLVKGDRPPMVHMSTLSGTNSMLVKDKVEYEILPRLESQFCSISSEALDQDLEALPDLAGWELVGDLYFEGQDAYLYQYEAQFEDKLVQYKFYVTKDDVPLRLHALGNELFGGAHYDEWVIDYTSYSPDPPHKSIFKIPTMCKDEKKGRSGSALSWHMTLPRIQYRGGHGAYDNFLTEFGGDRRHKSLAEYWHRSSIFEANHKLIETHNANPKRTYTMKMNRFGDWSREEFASLFPKKKRSANNNLVNDEHEVPYKPLVDPKSIPSSIDWRGTPMAGVVKDQANCGSCWAFGAVGTMESAWNKAHGADEQLSEQQVMDCSWGYVQGNEEAASACNGGDAYAGIGHIINAGGIARASEYNYLGQGDYCREESVEKISGFKGYSKIPQFDDTALMEAVYSRGAVAVSMDASQDSFTFYSEGVYFDSKCMWKSDDLDHSMLLVGYGTDPEHGDYWIVKNSWSTHWGDQGYFKVSRNNHGCGASTDAIYAVLDSE